MKHTTPFNARRAARWALALLALLLPMLAPAQQVTYFHTDALGSTVMESNEAGAVTYSRDFRPYGEHVIGATKEGPGFTGHVTDTVTGLTYMQQRYYDPGVGRFLSVDPVTADGNTGDNFNRYWYANNNPYKFSDPDGRLAFLVPVATGAARCAASAPCRIAVTEGTKRVVSWAGAAIAGAIGAVEGMRQANESAEPTETGKEPVPGAVDLVDDLAGQEATGQIEAGEGKVLSGMGDKKFDSETGTHDKVAISRDNADGTKTEVHADRNRQTGEAENVKIKQQGPNCRQAVGCGE